MWGKTMKHMHSFAVCAYKDSPYLEECIKSLCNQTLKSAIYISTSTGNRHIEKIAKKYSIPVVLNPEHAGIAADWSYAYNLCKTKYVTLAHQDDVYDPSYTETCLAQAEQYKDTLIAFTDYREQRKDIRISWNFVLLIKRLLLLPIWISGGASRDPGIKRLILSLGSPISCPTVMYNREKTGPFYFQDSFHVNMDWDAWVRISALSGRLVWIPKLLVTHRIHEHSQTNKHLQTRIRKQEDITMFERLWPGPIARLLGNIYFHLANF